MELQDCLFPDDLLLCCPLLLCLLDRHLLAGQGQQAVGVGEAVGQGRGNARRVPDCVRPKVPEEGRNFTINEEVVRINAIRDAGPGPAVQLYQTKCSSQGLTGYRIRASNPHLRARTLLRPVPVPDNYQTNGLPGAELRHGLSQDIDSEILPYIIDLLLDLHWVTPKDNALSTTQLTPQSFRRTEQR